MTREKAIYELEDAKDGYAEYLSIDAINMAIEALKQPEIIRCKDCKHNPKYEWFGCPASHLNEKQKPDSAFCWRGERRTE